MGRFDIGYKLDDKGKLNIHIIRNSGIIEVWNPSNKLLVTVKIARPGQIDEVYSYPEYKGWDSCRHILEYKNKSKPNFSQIIKKCRLYQENLWNYDRYLPPETTYENWKKD